MMSRLASSVLMILSKLAPSESVRCEERLGWFKCPNSGSYQINVTRFGVDRVKPWN